MGELFFRLRKLSLRGYLELRGRTARAIAVKPKEDLGECFGQYTLTWEDSVLEFVRLECSKRGKSFCLRLSFIYLFLKSSLLFHKKLFVFEMSSDLIPQWRGGKMILDERSLSPIGRFYLIINCVLCIGYNIWWNFVLTLF